LKGEKIMPQATDEQRIEWGGESGVGDDKAIRHLLKRGFVFTRGGIIHPPEDYDCRNDPTDCEGAIDFLCDEWDYGYDKNPTTEVNVFAPESIE
jgi:hypothetical protein